VKSKSVLFAASLLVSSYAQSDFPVSFVDAQVSSDGAFVLARVENDGQQDKFIVTDAKTKQVITTLGETRNRAIDWCNWVNKERFVCQYRSSSKKVGVVQGVTAVVAYDFNGGNRQMIFGDKNFDMGYPISYHLKSKKAHIQVVDKLPDEPKSIIVLEYPLERTGLYLYSPSESRSVSLSKIDVYSGKRKLIKRMSFAQAQSYSS